nr:MAG TPA_asm: hypothetical protein [Bacteriophage sp.]
MHSYPHLYSHIYNILYPFFIFNTILFFIPNKTILIHSNKITLLTSFFILIYITHKPLLFTLINTHFIIINFIIFIFLNIPLYSFI